MVQPEQLPRYLKHIANLYHKVVCSELNLPQLNNYFDILPTIDRCSKPLTQKQLAELMYIDKSSMVAIVNFLLENEFIVVRVNPQDRRENFISLADKGKRAVYRIKKVERYIYGHVLNGGIEDGTIPALFESLSKLELKLKRVSKPVTDEKDRT